MRNDTVGGRRDIETIHEHTQLGLILKDVPRFAHRTRLVVCSDITRNVFLPTLTTCSRAFIPSSSNTGIIPSPPCWSNQVTPPASADDTSSLLDQAYL